MSEESMGSALPPQPGLPPELGRGATATAVQERVVFADPRPASTWGLGPSGIRTVFVLELRQRIRSTRWIVVLVVWTAILAALTILIRWAVHRVYTGLSDAQGGAGLDGGAARAQAEDLANRLAGRLTFGIIVFLVLSLAGLVAPALSATSVNGDRQAGVLATLQTTLLTPAQIVVGKLLAAWVTGLALLGAALPFLLWIYLEGGTPFGRLLVVLAVMALTILVVCAIGLGWSAITARTSSSAVLTYLTVALLGPGLPLLFLLSVPLVTETKVVPIHGQQLQADGQVSGTCQDYTEVRPLTYTNRSWWLLAASPYVIVADASPKPLLGASEGGTGSDPLSGIRDGVRDVRLGPQIPVEECYVDDATQNRQAEQRRRDRDALGVTWPFGLAADLAVGAAFGAVAVRRLRTPTRRLPTGTRVA